MIAVQIRAFVAVFLCMAAPHPAYAEVTAGSAVYVRHDTDHTTVVAPRLSVGAPVSADTRLDVAYTTDVWTSASIDIRTSASRPVTEQRDEVNATLSHDLSELRVSGSYRYSHEPDYSSHGAALAFALDLAQKSTTLELRLAATIDQVGRAGDPLFARDLRNLSARLAVTQLLDTQTFVQLVYELMSAHGFNASAYRFIGIGSADGTCRGAAFYCIPEVNPTERLRHALAANIRRALSERVSVGLGYRFYLDSWALRSHTANAELALSPAADWLLSVGYRFYSQTAASQFRSTFSVSDSDVQYYSNDKELSTFVSHRVAVAAEKELEYQRGSVTLILSAALSRYVYSNYLPVPSIDALELTLAARMHL